MWVSEEGDTYLDDPRLGPVAADGRIVGPPSGLVVEWPSDERGFWLRHRESCGWLVHVV